MLKKYSVTKNCTDRINCSSDLKKFANSQSSASNYKIFSRIPEQFFLTVGKNNFDNKIPFHNTFDIHKMCYLLQISSQITWREIGFAVMGFLSPIYSYMGDKKKLASEIGMNRKYKPLVSLITFLLQKEIYIEKVFSREIFSD